MDGVISLFESKTASIHTTRTWEFLGLEKASGPQSPDSLWAKTNYGEDVIVGVLDTGEWLDAHRNSLVCSDRIGSDPEN